MNAINNGKERKILDNWRQVGCLNSSF